MNTLSASETKTFDQSLIYRDSMADLKDIIYTLKEYGIIAFRGLVKTPLLQKLNQEFDHFITHYETAGYHFDKRDYLTQVRALRTQLNKSFYPATYDFFSSNFMAQVALNYYGTQNLNFNREIFISENAGTVEEVQQLPFLLHFDKSETFKFFLYLTDTSAENGAMHILPGSYSHNRETRIHALQNNIPLGQIDNVLEDVNNESIPVEGPAGTLFIFNTDLGHKAGHVQPSQVRRIMRGHTRPI